MSADNELSLDETAKEELEGEELGDLAGGIACAPPEQVSLEPMRVF